MKGGCVLGGLRSSAAAFDDSPVASGPSAAVALECDPPADPPAGLPADSPVVDRPAIPTLPVRRHPSKNSVLRTGFRSVVLFVTVAVEGRRPVLATPEMVARLLGVWAEASRWIVGRYVVMPDHLHFFCAPLSDDCTFQRWMTFWKSRFSRGLDKFEGKSFFQDGCWDTQMRTGRQYREKWEYVRNNPVRKALVNDADEWPYQGVVNDLVWHD